MNRVLRWTYYGCMFTAGMIAGIALVLHAGALSWLLVVECVVLGVLFARQVRP